MLKVGSEYTERISDSTALGAGIVKLDGFAVFVFGALTGELCRFRITEIKKRYAHARLLELLEASPDRREVDCAVFENCGGCTLRHASPSLECDIKGHCVMNAFRQLRLAPEKLAPTEYPSDETRNGVHIHIAENGDFGFYAEGSNSVCRFPEDGCRLIPSELCDIAKCVSDGAARQDALPAQLFLRRSTSGQIAVCITSRRAELLSGLSEKLTESNANITGVLARKSEDEPYRLLCGTPFLESTLSSLRFRISPEAFFQVNYAGGELLFAKVLEYAKRCEFSYCADLYCGTGVLGIVAAAHFRSARFVGVEINESAVADARVNAELNGLTNISFYCGDAARFASESSPELVILDPPRRGLSDSMKSVVLKIAPPSIIYVSCDPFTLARDCAVLTQKGYTLEELSPINMFPKSSHVETVALLRRCDTED